MMMDEPTNINSFVNQLLPAPSHSSNMYSNGTGMHYYGTNVNKASFNRLPRKKKPVPSKQKTDSALSRGQNINISSILSHYQQQPIEDLSEQFNSQAIVGGPSRGIQDQRYSRTESSQAVFKSSDVARPVSRQQRARFITKTTVKRKSIPTNQQQQQTSQQAANSDELKGPFKRSKSYFEVMKIKV